SPAEGRSSLAGAAGEPPRRDKPESDPGRVQRMDTHEGSLMRWWRRHPAASRRTNSNRRPSRATSPPPADTRFYAGADPHARSLSLVGLDSGAARPPGRTPVTTTPAARDRAGGRPAVVQARP